jgi:hypothetical protein
MGYERDVRRLMAEEPSPGRDNPAHQQLDDHHRIRVGGRWFWGNSIPPDTVLGPDALPLTAFGVV